MQTQIGLFDLSAKAPSNGCGKVGPKALHRSEAGTQGKIDGFMEIMGALLALPPGQLAKSLAELDAETLKEAADGDLCSKIGDDSEDLATAQLLKAFLVIKDEIGQTGDSKDLPLKTDELAGMVQSLLNGGLGPQVQSSSPDNETTEAPVVDLKAKWRQLYDQIQLSARAGQDRNPSDGAAIPDEMAVQDELAEAKGIQPAAGALEEIAADDDDAAASDGNAGDMELPKSAMAHRDKVAGVSTKPGFHADAQGKPASAPKGDFQGTGPVEPVTPEPAADQLLFEASDPGSGDANDDTGIDLLTVKNDSAGESLSKTTLSGLGRQDPLNRMEFGGNQATAAGAEIKEATAENKELRNEVIRQIVQRMSMHTQGDQSRMEIRLKPEFLGNVHLQVLTENHQVSVRMTADSMAVKEIVEQNIQHLKLELQQHGLEIQKFDVFVGGDSQQWRGGQNQAGFRQAFRQRQQRFGNSKAGMDDSLGISTVDSNKKYSQTDPNEIDYFV